MHLFYTPDINGDTYLMSEEESRHASRVLRLQIGDEVFLTDGKGSWMPSEIMDNHPKRCMVRVKEKWNNYKNLGYELHMAVAPTKNINRFEWYLEKATEIGIARVIPILTSYSERKEVKLQRLNKVITAAMKQSLKAWHPTLDEMTKFEDVMTRAFDGKKFIAWCEADVNERLETFLTPKEKALILIGPEGGFSKDEIKMAQENGFQAVSVSKSRLRTETAAIVACHSVAFINQN